MDGADPPVPAVIASHVDIRYTVFGAGTGKRLEERSRLGRLLSGAGPQVGTREVHAVKDVSFVAHQGESIGLIGRNGSGKSTLLRAVAGLIPPSSGDIYLNGKAALLGVNAVLMRKLSGSRNVMIGGQALGLTRAEVRAKYDEIVGFADIGEFINLPMSAYSSGMAARLRFAISTAAVPDILVVDEALSTGDAEFRAKAAARIDAIRESAGTIFVVSHSASQVQSLCTRALWMEKGELIMDGDPAEVAAAYTERFPGRRPAKPAKPAKKPAKGAGGAGGPAPAAGQDALDTGGTGVPAPEPGRSGTTDPA